MLLLTPALVAALELGCRANDHRPSVVDDADLWAEQRSKAKGDAVVLLGASRIQLGFASDVFKERFPRRSLVHLAQNAQQPFATLRDLAEDEAFRGVVLCAARSETFSARHREDQALLVEHYHSHATLNGALNRRAATFFEERLVVRNPNARLDWMAAGLLRGEGLRGRAYIETRSDRSRSADYQVRGEAWLKAHRAERVERWRLAYTEPAPSPETWRADLAHAKPLVERIQARGGVVVFVRMPTSGELRELDRGHRPRDRFWDLIGPATGALTIHFEDDPTTRGFECPDTSHLDRRDATVFTIALLDLLVARGVLQ